MKSLTIKDSMTSLLMKPTSAGKDTLHKLDQALKKLAYVSNHWGPLLNSVTRQVALTW
ncbi:putative adhesin [Vibrio astriarenae]|nr:putative adhesin [Vibrio sp. C7]